MGIEHDKRVIVYPNYLNSTKTVAEGRRIPKDKACSNPQLMEMLDSCTKGLMLPAALENKAYSRDWLVRGRLRVQLKDSDGKPVNPNIPTRTVLMLRMAELIPKHPMRRQKASTQPQDQTMPSAAAAQAPTGNNTKKDKKDKKNKRR